MPSNSAPWKKFIKCNFGLFASMTYPDADSTRLRMSADFTSLLFAYDDIMDLSENLMRDKLGGGSVGDYVGCSYETC